MSRELGSRESDLAKEFARIGEWAKRQRKEFDKAMKPIIERLHDLAEPAGRTESKRRLLKRKKS